MTEHNQRGDAYSQLIAISYEALEGEHYEAAYHALAAAMHYARDLKDKQGLASVKQAAKAHQDWIDAHTPEHRMSTQSVNERHGTSMLNMLSTQAGTQEKIVDHEHHSKRIKDLPWYGDKDEI